MTHFLAMGGYADFVWPAYGISAVGLVAATFLTLRAYWRARHAVARLESGHGDAP